MMKKKYKWTKKEQKEIGDLISKYKQKLNLNSWEIDYKMHDGVPVVGDEVHGENFVSFSHITVTPAYEKADISFLPALLMVQRNGEGKDFENTVKHELSHCLTEELYQLSFSSFKTEKQCNDAVERLTQRISRII